MCRQVGRRRRVGKRDLNIYILNDAAVPWGPDGTILFAPNAGSPLQRVAATGGTPSAITKLDATHRDLSHRWPHFLPDGRHYLCFVMTSKPENYAIAVGSMDNPNLKILAHSDSAP